MTRDQRTVAIGALIGVAAMAASVWLLMHALPVPVGVESAGDKLGYAAKWLAPAALPLFAMLVAVGNARFASEAIDPTLGGESPVMIVNGRVADNTVQQLILFIAATLALAPSLPVPSEVEGAVFDIRLIGAAAIAFAVCRIVFWIGYRIHPLYRAPGFSSTAYLTLGPLMAAVWAAVT